MNRIYIPIAPIQHERTSHAVVLLVQAVHDGAVQFRDERVRDASGDRHDEQEIVRAENERICECSSHTVCIDVVLRGEREPCMQT